MKESKYNFLIIALFAVVIFLPSLGNDFINIDDHVVITNNKRLEVDSISEFLSLLIPGPPIPGLAEYMPLKEMSLAIDILLWGKNPQLMRIQGMIWHVLSALAFYLFIIELLFFLVRLRNKEVDPDKIKLAGLIISLLFVSHPVHVDSFAWLSSRKDLLCGSFSFFSLYFYLRYITERQSQKFIFSILMFILALLSKPNALFIPGFIFAIELIGMLSPQKDSKVFLTKSFSRISCFMIPGLAYALFYYLNVFPPEESTISTSSQDVALPLIWVEQIAQYIKMTLLPVCLVPMPKYQFPDAISSNFLASIILFSAFMVSLVISFLKEKGIFLLLTLFLIPIIPVLLNAPFGQYWTPRYLYFSVAGIISLPFYLSLVHSNKYNKALSIVGITIAVFYAAITISYSLDFSNSQSIWTRQLKCDPQNEEAYYKLAIMNYEKGNLDQAQKILILCEQLKETKPKCFELNSIIMFSKQKPKQAIEHLNKAADKYKTASLYRTLGLMYARLGQHEKAIAIYDKGITGQQTTISNLINYTKFLWSMGKTERALKVLDTIKSIRKDYDPTPEEILKDLKKQVDNK